MASFVHSMFIDFNSFFASVEQAQRPELRGRPVAVVPLLPVRRGAVGYSPMRIAFNRIPDLDTER